MLKNNSKFVGSFLVAKQTNFIIYQNEHKDIVVSILLFQMYSRN